MKASLIQTLITDLGLNYHTFEKEIKASNGSVSALIKRDGDITQNLKNKIILRYPETKGWLETGKKYNGKIKEHKHHKLIKDMELTVERLQEQIKELKMSV